MADPHSERSVRIDKAKRYQEQFGTPYPSASHRTHTVHDLKLNFDTIQTSVCLAGRVRQWREHGKLTFIHLEDASGRIQVALSVKELKHPTYADLKLFDVGDIVEVNGKPFITNAGEQSLLASEIHLLTKAVQPLPDEWYGLQDEEQRYRRRYVDMILRPELREMLAKKAIFWNSMRTFLLQEGFQEVETPVLEATPGGADAQPFVTHHNALDIDLYLRISMGELWQKRLMVAGFEKTFEIGRQFRNEGISPEHLQDYTQMEFYWAFANYENTMELVERMYKHVIQQTFGKLRFDIKGFAVDFEKPWQRIDYVTTVQEKFGINVLEASVDDLKAKLKELNLNVDEAAGRGRLIDQLWKQCRKVIAGPVFLVNHPVEVSPLAKRKVEQPQLVERYQVIIAGSELGNGYTELNDPIDQAARFQVQADMRAAGDAEAQMHDADFVEALEYGMPPTSGFGLSERLFSFLMDKPIRETVAFPLLRPKTMANEPVAQAAAAKPNTSADASLGQFEPGISRADALAWMQEKVSDAHLRTHMLATEAMMLEAAKRFNAANPEAWGIAGLLHDIDYGSVPNEQHSLVGAEWLAERNVNSLIVDAVREHNGKMHGIEPGTIMSKALYCLEQTTGLIMAAVAVRPDKDINNVELKSLKKKFKDKAFAKNVDRTITERCSELLGITVEEGLELTLKAMQLHAKELGY